MRYRTLLVSDVGPSDGFSDGSLDGIPIEITYGLLLSLPDGLSPMVAMTAILMVRSIVHT